MTSKQCRKAAATRFVTSIDMWDLGKFPFEMLLLSMKSFIAECPAGHLAKITSWRMPHTGSYSRSLDFTEPILGSLTSLHAADSENDDHLQLSFLLERCTALKQLYYRSNRLGALESYLSSQPTLQALAVDLQELSGDCLDTTAKLGHPADRSSAQT
jgi:hypothetical protein